MVNTFLPYKNFEKSAKILDNQRLNKQITEAYQILDGCLDDSYSWSKHPACKIWKGHEKLLLQYIACCIDEWRSRGFSSHSSDKFVIYANKVYDNNKYITTYQNCLITTYLCLTHKSNLFRKFWEKFFKIIKSRKHKQLKKLPFQYLKFWYAGFGFLEYYWPNRNKNKIWRFMK